MFMTWAQKTLRGTLSSLVAPALLLAASLIVAVGGSGAGALSSLGQLTKGPDVPPTPVEMISRDAPVGTDVAQLDGRLVASAGARANQGSRSAGSGPSRTGPTPSAAGGSGGASTRSPTSSSPAPGPAGGSPGPSGSGPGNSPSAPSAPAPSAPPSSPSPSAPAPPPNPVQNLLDQTLKPVKPVLDQVVGGLRRGLPR